MLNRPLPFKKPKKSKDLAEFIGIMLGDGGMNKRQIFVTLHHYDDKQYAKFVVQLMEKLFRIAPSIIHRPKYSVNNLVISRSGLARYLNSLGLPIGDKIKQRINIPKWVKQNPKYKIACLRGLVDTDGSVFNHKYKVRKKLYSYGKLSFTSASPPLRNSVYEILKELDFNPRITKQIDVRLDSRRDFRKYFELIGSHNPKHLKKLKYML